MPGWFRALLHFLRAVAEWLNAPFDRLGGAGVPARALFAIVAVVLLVHAAVRLTRSATAAVGQDRGTTGPAGPRRDEAWFWRRADLLMGQGAYGDAMLAAFHAAMLSLDRRGALTYRPSATPRELLERARLAPDQRGRFGALLGALYRTAFALEPITAEEYRAWVRSLREASDAPAA